MANLPLYSSWQTPAILARALVAINMLDAERARQALSLLPRSGIASDYRVVHRYVHCKYAAYWGNPFSALKSSRAATPFERIDAEDSGLDYILTVISETNLMLALGDAHGASQLLGTVQESKTGIVSPSIFDLSRARVAIALGDNDYARAIATRIVAEDITPWDSAGAVLLLAAIAYSEGEFADAAENMRNAVDLEKFQRIWAIRTMVPEDIWQHLAELAEERMAPLTTPTRHVPNWQSSARLTPREVAILNHLVDGLSVAEIVESDAVSRNTIKSQLRSLYRKLGVATQAAAVQAAIKRPWLLRR